MLGDPIPFVSPALGMLREIERVPKRNRGSAAVSDWREIENRKRNHWLYCQGKRPDRNESEYRHNEE